MKRWRFLIKPLILAAIIAAAGLFLLSSRDHLRLLANIAWWHIVLLLITVMAGIAVNGLIVSVILRTMDVKLAWHEWFGISACNSMFNYFLPGRAANIMRAVYFKQRYGLAYARYVSLLASVYIVSFLVASGLGLAVTVLYGIITGRPVGLLVSLFASLLCLTAAGTFVAIRTARKDLKTRWDRLNRIMASVSTSFTALHADRRLMRHLVILTAAAIFIFSLQVYLSFTAVGITITPLEAVIIQALEFFSWVISITPANLGVREAIISGTAGLLGIAPASAAVAAIVSRAAFMVAVFGTGTIFAQVLAYSPARNRPEKENGQATAQRDEDPTVR